MSGFLFIGAVYIYVVGGIIAGASLYLDDNSNSTLAVQYGKGLIILLLWPIFLIVSGHLRKNTLTLLSELVSAATQTAPPPPSSKRRDVVSKELVERFLKEEGIIYVHPSLLSSPYRRRSIFTTMMPAGVRERREQQRDRGNRANAPVINSFSR